MCHIIITFFKTKQFVANVSSTSDVARDAIKWNANPPCLNHLVSHFGFPRHRHTGKLLGKVCIESHSRIVEPANHNTPRAGPVSRRHHGRRSSGERRRHRSHGRLVGASQSGDVISRRGPTTRLLVDEIWRRITQQNIKFLRFVKFD